LAMVLACGSFGCQSQTEEISIISLEVACVVVTEVVHIVFVPRHARDLYSGYAVRMMMDLFGERIRRLDSRHLGCPDITICAVAKKFDFRK
jgi:hypothetical protein